MSTTEGRKTTVYTLLVANSASSSDSLLPLITTLDLSWALDTGNNFSFFVANVLPKMVNLTSLTLYDNNIGDDGARSIAESTSLTNLTSLNLTKNQIGDAGARSIAKSTCLPNLTALRLSINQIGDDSARSLAESTTLTNLRSLPL